MFGWKELSSVETQILTSPSISGRVISKKAQQETCVWVWDVQEGSPRLQYEKEAAHGVFFPSAIWACVGGSKQGFMTAAVDPTPLSKFSSNFILVEADASTWSDLSLICILEHQSFRHLIVNSIILFAAFVFNVLPTRWGDPLQSVQKFQPVCLDLYQSWNHEAKEIEKASWAGECGGQLCSQDPFCPSIRAHAWLIHSISHLWEPCDRQLADEWKGLGRAHKQEFRHSKCTHLALGPLSSSEHRQNAGAEGSVVWLWESKRENWSTWYRCPSELPTSRLLTAWKPTRKLWCRRKLLRNQLNLHWKDWCWSRSSNTLVTWLKKKKSQLIEKDPDAGKDWGKEKKGATEDETVGWHHWHNGHELRKLQETVKDREAWCVAVHGITKSWTWLSNWTTATMEMFRW